MIDKISNVVHTDKPITQSITANVSVVSTGIPEVFRGKWGNNNNAYGCNDEDGKGVWVIDANRIDGYDDHHLLVKSTGKLSNDNTFAALFNSKVEGSNSKATIRLQLMSDGTLLIGGNGYFSDDGTRYQRCSNSIIQSDDKATTHNTIPTIKSGIAYGKARSILLNQGYKPKNVCNTDATVPALCKTYPEIEACSGDSESCKMVFSSPNGQDIEVFTSSPLPRYGKQTKDAVFDCVQQSESQMCFN